MSGRILCLIDSNVLIYLHDPSDPAKQRQAGTVLEYLGDRNRIVLSTQCLTEFHSTVTRRLPRSLSVEDAQASLMELASIAVTVYPVTLDVVNDAATAAATSQMSIWDALIWAVAYRNGIPTILTEDVQSRPIIEGVRYVNPFDPDFDLKSL